MEQEMVSGFDDEYRDHIHSALDHLMFMGVLARRTGLYERIDEVGWSYGGHEYYSGGAHGVFGEQAAELARILEGDKLAVYLFCIDELTAYTGDRSPIVIEALESEVGEEDLIGIIEGETDIVEAYAQAYGEGKRGFTPERMRTSVEVIEEHPELAQWVADYYPDDIRSRRAFLVSDGLYEWGSLYDWFESLVDAWEVVHEAKRGREEDGEQDRERRGGDREDQPGVGAKAAAEAHGDGQEGRDD